MDVNLSPFQTVHNMHHGIVLSVDDRPNGPKRSPNVHAIAPRRVEPVSRSMQRLRTVSKRSRNVEM